MSQKSATTKDGGRSGTKGNGAKSKSGFLARQVSNKRVVKETDLLSKKGPITPEDVLGLEAATSGELTLTVMWD